MSKSAEVKAKSTLSAHTEPKDPKFSLTGQFLIATPSLRDRRFRRSVIYLCAHDSEHAMGVIINRPHKSLTLPELLSEEDEIDTSLPDHPIVWGGPVERERGFVLHSPDFFDDGASLKLSPTLSLTTTRSVLDAMGKPHGPERAVVALGYAGWSAGQLEGEIADNAWLTAPADEALIFKASASGWTEALDILGVKPEQLSRLSGTA